MLTDVKLIDESQTYESGPASEAVKVHVWRGRDIIAVEHKTTCAIIKDGQYHLKQWQCLSDLKVAYGESEILIGPIALMALSKAFMFSKGENTNQQPNGENP